MRYKILLFLLVSLSTLTPNSHAEDTTPKLDTTQFKDWLLKCGKTETDSKKLCILEQTLFLKEKNQRILSIVIKKSPELDKFFAVITAPLGIYLAPGLHLQVDQRELKKFPVTFCFQQGCQTHIEFTEELANDFKKGEKCKIAIFDTNQKMITLGFSLSGFTKAFSALKKIKG
jgi:invasion protein IalB